MTSVYVGASGCVTPLGFTTQSNLESLLAGRSALGPRPFLFSEQDICCAYINSHLWQHETEKALQTDHLTKLESLCCLAIQDVIEQSGADLKRKDSLLILASTKGNIDILDGSSAINDPSRVYLPNFAKTIAQFFQAENAPLIVSNACISGLLAMIIAQRYLRAGTYKTIVVCGGDLVSEFTLSGFRSFNALSDKACRPFDKNRSGINLGEAAAAVVLTCEQTDIELINGASANDANHISGPARDGQGLLHAIQNVASSAELKSIDFISAHGTATEYNDEMEATAFSRCQLSEVPLHSLKGYYGHTLGAAGVLEAIMAVESLRKNTLIASLGFSEQGTTAAQRMITTTHTQPLTSFLKTASGFGGCNAAALFRKTK